MWKNEPGIQTHFFRNMIVITLTSIGLWCLIWIQGEYSAFKTESDSVRAEYIQSRKTMLKKEVAAVIEYINETQELSKQDLQRTLKERVYEAHQIAMNIYQENVASQNPADIMKMIKDALRPIRYNNGRGYYFAVSMAGIEQLYPIRPEFEGEDLTNLQDLNGNFVIQEEIDIVTKKGEGFVSHFWTIPEKDPAEMYQKISFVKHFKPLGWYFGTGEYIDNYEEQIKQRVLDRIVKLRFETEGYFFGSTFKGGSLFSNGKITRGGGSVWDLTDPDGIKIIQEQSKAAGNTEGGFVSYSWIKLNTSVPSPKISFVQGIPEWEWTIGAGMYLDTIEEIIAENETTLIAGLTKKINRSLIVLVLLLCLIIFWTKRISSQIQRSINTFVSFLERASTDSIAIDPDELHLKEFKEIATATNKMLADRRQAEEELQESEEKYRSIFENGVEGFFQSTPEGRFISVNPAFASMLGYASPEEITENITNIAHQYYVDQEDRQRYIQHLQKNGSVEHFEFKAQCKDGSHIWLSNSTRVIYDQKGNIDRYEGNITNITERKKTEKERLKLETQLQQSQKMEAIGTLAGGIAHDFNNILTAILGYCEIVKYQLPENDQIKQDLDQIIKASGRAVDLVNQILTFSRQGKEDFKPLKIQPIITETFKLLRSSLPTTIQLKENIDTDTGLILADPTQMHQILMNLSTNAKHAIGENIGTLTVSLSEIQVSDNHSISDCSLSPGTYLDLIFSDTGCGMDGLTRSRIFEPFFSTKEKGKGTGLGLAVVHGIVKQHKGAITVTSTPGQGTTFHIYLPVIAGEVHTKKTIDTVMERGSERILLVDDEEVIGRMMQRILDSLGYDVTVFTSSIEALAKYTNNPDDFDLIITDMTMPEMNGTVLARNLLALRPGLPIILCTGFSEAIDEATAKSFGIREYIMKPVNKAVLAKVIRMALTPKPRISG